MAKLTYAQIRELQKQYGQESMPTDQFAQLMNRTTGSSDYEAGVGQGLGAGLHAVDYGIDAFLNKTGLPEFTGDIGETFFGNVGRTAFEAAPRMTADMLPLLAGGIPGLVGMAGTIGTNTYGKTDSPAAGLVGAGMGAAMGPIGRRVGAAAVRGYGALGGNVATLGSKMAASEGAQLGLRSNPQLLNAVMGATGREGLVSPLARVVGSVGEQAGQYGMNVATQAATGAIAAPEGEKWNTVKQVFEPHNLAAAALSQAMFAPLQMPREVRRAPEVRMADGFVDTWAKYGEDVVRPQGTRDQLAAEVQQRMSQAMGRVAVRKEQAGPTVAERPLTGSILDVNKPVTKLPSMVAQVTPTPILWDTPSTPEFEAAVAAAKPPEAAPVVGVAEQQGPAKPTPSESYAALPAETRATLINSPDPAVSGPAVMHETRTKPVDVQVAVEEATTVKGQSKIEALQEKLEAKRLKAQENLAAKEQRKAEVARVLDQAKAAKVAAEDAARQPELDWWNNWRKTADPELLKLVSRQFAKIPEEADPTTLATAQNAVRKLLEAGIEPSFIVSKVDGIIKGGLKKRRATTGSQTVVGLNTDGSPKFGKPGDEGQDFGDTASLKSSELNANEDAEGTGYMWHVQASGKKKLLVRTPVAQRVAPDFEVANLDASGAKPEDVIAASLSQARGNPTRAKTPAQKTLVQVVTDPMDWMNKVMDPKLWLDVPKDINPKNSTEQLIQVMTAMRDSTMGLSKTPAMVLAMERGGFKSVEDFQSFMSDTSPILGAYAQMLPKKFLGISPVGAGISAGGGFWYNVGELIQTKKKNGGVSYSLGKHTIPDSGRVSEEYFVKIGKGTNLPLNKGEVELYKLLVPEAFADGQVDVKRLMELLPTREPAVQVHEYGQDGKQSAAKMELDKMTHEWFDTLTREQKLQSEEAEHNYNPEAFLTHSGWTPEQIAVWDSYSKKKIEVAQEPRDNSPRATSYYNTISPFDTKKYPVSRVDVVLPSGRMEVFNNDRGVWSTRDEKGQNVREHTSQEAAQKHAQYFTEKWQADNLHENLPNTLGWAMVQYVPHPVTVETVAVVAEQQSRWGQARQKETRYDTEDVGPMATRYGLGKIPPHPLLDYQHELVLKAVVAEARKRGVGKVFVSDGESAMMTEGHDTAARVEVGAAGNEVFAGSYLTAEQAKAGGEQRISQTGRQNWKVKVEQEGVDKFVAYIYDPALSTEKTVSQAGGMRLHYDTTLPSAMGKITGGKGEVVDMGVHKNAGEETYLPVAAEGGMPPRPQQRVKGSPVFRDAAGKPKTQVTGRMWDVSGVRLAETANGGKAMIGDTRPDRMLNRAFGSFDSTAMNAAKKHGSIAVVTKSAKIPGAWQVSRISSPTGAIEDLQWSSDAQYPSYEAALNAAKEYHAHEYSRDSFNAVMSHVQKHVYKNDDFLVTIPQDRTEFDRLLQESQKRGAAFGAQDNSFTGYQGERLLLPKLLAETGLAGPEVVGEASRLLSLIDNTDLAYAKLLTGDGQTHGLFTQQTDGQKLVWLAAQNDPNRMLFVLSHEQNGHALWELHKAGKLDEASSRTLQEYSEFVAENPPEVNQRMMEAVWETMPDRYRKDSGLKEMVMARLDDPDEVLANMNAMISLALVNAKPGAWAKFMRWMPQPIVGAINTMVKFGRKMTEALSGVLFNRRIESRGGLEPAQEQQMNKYVDTMYSLLKLDKQRASEIEAATKLAMVQDPLAYSMALADGSLLETAPDAAGAIVKAFGGKPSTDEGGVVRKGLRKISKGYDASINPLMRAAKLRPVFREIASAGVRQEHRTNNALSDIFKNLNMHFDGVGYVSDKNNSVMMVETHPTMSRIRDDIQLRSQVLGKDLPQLLADGDAETKALIAKLPAQHQTLVREALAKRKLAQDKTNELAKDLRYQQLVFTSGRALMLEDSTLKARDAHKMAAQMVESAKNGVQLPGTNATDLFVNNAARRIEEDFAYFMSHPEWVSESRHGDFEVRYHYKDTSRKSGYERAKTEKEFVQILQRLEEQKASGEIAEIVPRAVKKESFDARKAALDMFASREADMNARAIADFERMGVDPAQARAILEQNSPVAEMQRELAMRQLPNRVERRHADGRLHLDMLQQQFDSTNMLIHGLSKAVTNAEHSMHMQDPEVLAHPDRELFAQAWKNYRNPDPASVRAVQKLGYYGYLSFNFLNMLQDAVQPITGALVPDMIADGQSMVKAYGNTMKWFAKIKNQKSMTADERAALERFRNGNRGMAAYSDELNNDVLASINTRRLVDGKEEPSTAHWLTSKLGGALLMNKRFHKKFTDFGMETAFMANYEHMRDFKKMSHADAERAAIGATALAMGSAGKSGRPVGIWSADKMRSVSAMMTALQSYSLNQIGAMKNYAETALSGQKLDKGQRKAALKAFGAHTSMMFAQAGLLGLPFAGAAMLLVDKVFGINSKEMIASMLADDEAKQDGSEYATQHIALHGLFNMLGGDVASRSGSTGILGVNDREGFSVESMAGPTFNMLTKAFGGAADAIREGDPLAFAQQVLPNQLKKAVQLYKDGGEWKRKDGTLIAKSAGAEKFMSALLGVKPTRVANVQERDAWQRVDAQLEQDERSAWLDETLGALDSGDVETVRASILSRAESKGEQPQAIASAMAKRSVERVYGKDPRQSPGFSERLGLASGASGTELSETDRLMLMQRVMEQMGFGLSRQRFQSAQQIDVLRRDRPWLPTDEARAMW